MAGRRRDSTSQLSSAGAGKESWRSGEILLRVSTKYLVLCNYWRGQELTDIFSLCSCRGGSQDASWRGETQEAGGDQQGDEEQKDDVN